MKKISIGIIVFTSVFSHFSGAQAPEIPVVKGQPLYIEYQAPTDQEAMSILVTEKQSAKQAVVTLFPQPGQPRTWYSFLVIRLGEEIEGSQVLEFRTRDGKPLFAHTYQSPSVKKGLAVSLFATEEALESFAQEFDAKIREKELSALPKAPEADKGKTLTPEQQQKMQEQTRFSLEATAAMKRQQSREEQEKLSADEREKRVRAAANLVKAALARYDKRDYKGAEKRFARAIQLDPDNNNYYFQYAVCLHKNNKYNRSLTMLSMAEGGDYNQVEYDYYLALNHMKLKEYEKAEEEFLNLKEENDPKISPVAAFFAGSIQFQFTKYKEAKANFEYTLDNSQDPGIDKEAEKMIEEIDRIESFIASSKEIFRYTFALGPIYDGNVLNVATQNTTTDVEAYRLSYSGTFLLKYLKTMSTELGVQLLLSDMYSLDKNFKSEATLQDADPQVGNLSLPSRHDFQMLKRAWSWSLSPSYQTLTMSAGSDKRRNILTTTAVATDLTTAVTGSWIAAANVEYALDKSHLEVTAEEANSTASRLTVGTTQTKLLGLDGKKTLSLNLAHTANAAQGWDNTYAKNVVSLTYGYPFFWTSYGSFKLEYSASDYPLATVERKDSATSAVISSSKDISKAWNMMTSLQYDMNASSIETNRYNKFVFTLIFTYTGSIQKD